MRFFRRGDSARARALSAVLPERIGVYALLPRAGSVLLTWRDAPYAEWQLPGGAPYPRESRLRALHREANEETGWRIAALRLLGSCRTISNSRARGSWVRKTVHVYVARPVRLVGTPERDHSAHWVPLVEAVDLLACPAQAEIARRFAGLSGPRHAVRRRIPTSGMPHRR